MSAPSPAQGVHGTVRQLTKPQHAPAKLAGHRSTAPQRRTVAAVVRQRYVPHNRLHLGPRKGASGCTRRKRASSGVRRTPRAKQTTLVTPNSTLRHAATYSLGSRRRFSLQVEWHDSPMSETSAIKRASVAKQV